MNKNRIIALTRTSCFFSSAHYLLLKSQEKLMDIADNRLENIVEHLAKIRSSSQELVKRARAKREEITSGF